eukprot:g5574.t1
MAPQPPIAAANPTDPLPHQDLCDAHPIRKRDPKHWHHRLALKIKKLRKLTDRARNEEEQRSKHVISQHALSLLNQAVHMESRLNAPAGLPWTQTSSLYKHGHIPSNSHVLRKYLSKYIGAQDGVLELEATDAPEAITDIHPNKQDLIISPVKWAEVVARLLQMDKTYFNATRQPTSDSMTPTPVDYDAIEKENSKIRSGILCRHGLTNLGDWISGRLNNARMRLEQQYRPGDPDESIPTKTSRPTRPNWRTKRTLDMLQEPRQDNHPERLNEPRDKPSKWTPLQREKFETSVQANIATQQGPQALMTRAVAAARAAASDTHPPQQGDQTSPLQPTTTPPQRDQRRRPTQIPATRLVFQQTLTEIHGFLTKGDLPPNPILTWKRWEQLARTLDIQSGTRAIMRLWSHREKEIIQPLTREQEEDLKEATNTIALARDQLNRTHQRSQMDARLRAMPDHSTQNAEWDTDRCLLYRKARQAKPRLHPSHQDTTAHYAELFRARLHTPREAHQLLVAALGPQAAILTPDASEQHSRQDILLGALDAPTSQETPMPHHQIPTPAEDPYPLNVPVVTEQDLTQAWGTSIRDSWDEHLRHIDQPQWTNAIIEYTTQQVTDAGRDPQILHNLTYHHRHWDQYGTARVPKPRPPRRTWSLYPAPDPMCIVHILRELGGGTEGTNAYLCTRIWQRTPRDPRTVFQILPTGAVALLLHKLPRNLRDKHHIDTLIPKVQADPPARDHPGTIRDAIDRRYQETQADQDGTQDQGKTSGPRRIQTELKTDIHNTLFKPLHKTPDCYDNIIQKANTPTNPTNHWKTLLTLKKRSWTWRKTRTFCLQSLTQPESRHRPRVQVTDQLVKLREKNIVGKGEPGQGWIVNDPETGKTIRCNSKQEFDLEDYLIAIVAKMKAEKEEK